MPVVLDNDTGERVLLYGADGATLREAIVDSSGRLIVVGAGAGGAVEAIQDTPADLKTAVHGIDGSTQRQILVDTDGRAVASEKREHGPTHIANTYAAAAVAPHSTTQRWTYTVPAGQQARVELVFCSVLCDGATATPLQAVSRIRYTPAGGSQVILLEAIIASGVVNTLNSIGVAMNMLMSAGDNLDGATADFSTGGTNRFIVTAKITQYDA